MKIHVIGGGGREHALLWKLKLDSEDHELHCAPGNAGIAQLAHCHAIKAEDIDDQVELAKRVGADLVIAGPETPLVLGISDRLQAEGIPSFGPTKAAARIEGSKLFCKELLAQYEIPTARFAAFDDSDEAKRFLYNQKMPVVIKADGLAAGKGVVIACNLTDALQAVDQIMIKRKFKGAGDRIVVEEFLTGKECSLIVLTDGEKIIPFLPARDYKPVFDGNKGQNTGGMGSYSPLNDMPEKMIREILNTIIQPTISALAKENSLYQGALYAGLILTDHGPKVLEFNCRFGDPETQVILPLLGTNFAELLLATSTSQLNKVKVGWYSRSAVCIVLASGGYPERYETGYRISGLENTSNRNTLIFHAGTAMENNGKLVTSGGRVLGIVGLGPDLHTARTHAYCGVSKIQFHGMHYRKDIGRIEP